MASALLRLRAALEALPVDAPGIALVMPKPELTKSLPRRSLSELRVATGEWLLALSIHIDETMAQAMADVETRWDAFDRVPLAPFHMRARGFDLRESWRPWLSQRTAGATEDGPQAATEAVWTIEAVIALVQTLERRLAALVRAEVSRPGGRLRVGSRPFLDVGLAIREVARAWS